MDLGRRQLLVVLLEYLIPIYGTKRFGGTKYGMWGSTIGLLAGLWFGPLGIVIGPFVGAFVGEMLATQDSSTALRSAWGSFVGFLFGSATQTDRMLCDGLVPDQICICDDHWIVHFDETGCRLGYQVGPK